MCERFGNGLVFQLISKNGLMVQLILIPGLNISQWVPLTFSMIWLCLSCFYKRLNILFWVRNYPLYYSTFWISYSSALGLSLLVVKFSYFNQLRFMSELDHQTPTAFGMFASYSYFMNRSLRTVSFLSFTIVPKLKLLMVRWDELRNRSNFLVLKLYICRGTL